MSQIICNAGPLIALSLLGRLELLKSLFDVVLVPEAVRKEIEHARDAARVTGRPAEILPIILEGPPPPPPPDALADLHFNDPLCYVIAAVEKLNALRPPRAE